MNSVTQGVTKNGNLSASPHYILVHIVRCFVYEPLGFRSTQISVSCACRIFDLGGTLIHLLAQLFCSGTNPRHDLVDCPKPFLKHFHQVENARFIVVGLREVIRWRWRVCLHSSCGATEEVLYLASEVHSKQALELFNCLEGPIKDALLPHRSLE